ncbi:hypothetical protein DFAR_1870002 [Desulfarculales bacterium]
MWTFWRPRSPQGRTACPGSRKNHGRAPWHRKAPTVYRFLHQQGLVGEQVAPSVDRRRFEAELPNDIWQRNAMHGPMLLVDDKRRKTYLFALIDDMSCLVVLAEFYLSEGLATYLQALRQALLKLGLSRKLYLDNAPPSAPTTWKRSPSLWASPWFTHCPTCLRARARSKDFSAPSGPSFYPASRAIPFGISMRPWSAGLGTSTTSASL